MHGSPDHSTTAPRVRARVIAVGFLVGLLSALSVVIGPASVRAEAACPTSAPESSLISPQHLVTGPVENGKEYLYVTETKAHQIARISRGPNGKVFLEARYETDEQVSNPHRIVLGPNELDLTSSLWWTETDSDTIGQMTFPTHGMISHGATFVEDGPTGITVGPDNLVWFTTNDPATSAGWLGNIDPNPPNAITQTQDGTGPLDIERGPPGTNYVWYAISIASKIRGINVFNFNDRPGPYDGDPPLNLNYPKALALAENGLLYLTDRCGDKIRSFDPDTGDITETCDLDPLGTQIVLPEDIIAVGPSNDFKLYFTEFQADQVESIRVLNGEPDCAGRQSYNLSVNSRPKGINLGPDDHVWFTEARSDRVARIKDNGKVQECQLPDPDIFPSSPMELDCITIEP